LGVTISGLPSAPSGRPGAAITPEEASLNGGCGVIGAGTLAVTGMAGGIAGNCTVAASSGGLILGSVLVVGNAGGRDECEIGSRSGGASIFPLVRNTFALLGATMTLDGPSVLVELTGVVGGASGTPGFGMERVSGIPGSFGVAGRACGMPGSAWVAKVADSGVVLEAAGEPVTGGAAALTWAGCGRGTDEGRVTVGIGLVTAVDHAGATGDCGTGVGPAGLICSVVAAEILGRGPILVEAGLSGRGGRLIRNVCRFGAFGSCGASAIVRFLFTEIP
jgi:hypothetical protein